MAAAASKTGGARRKKPSLPSSKKHSGGDMEMPPLGMDDATAKAIAASAIDIVTGGDGDVKAPGERQSADPRFKQFHEDRWDYMLSEMLEFREANGHCLVPHTFPANPQLARWVKRQRRQYKLMNDGKTSTMTPERATVLEQEGFVWDSHDAAWKEKIGDLRRYRAQHGHTLVPSSYKPNPHLATWVKCQRRQYKLFLEGKNSAMNAKRIAELEKEGFVWEIRGGSLKNAPPGSTGGPPLPTNQAAAASAMAAADAAASAALAAHGHGRASVSLPNPGAVPHPVHAGVAAAAATGSLPPMPRPGLPPGMGPPIVPVGIPLTMPSAGTSTGMPSLPVGYAGVGGIVPPVAPVNIPPAAPPVAAAAPPPPPPAGAVPPPVEPATTPADAAASNGDKKVAATASI
jgi:hypothetical protein